MVFAKSVAATWFNKVNKLLRESYPERQKALQGIIDWGMGNQESGNKRCYFTDSYRLRRRANARKVSFRISLRWPFTISTQLIKPNYLVILPTDAAVVTKRRDDLQPPKTTYNHLKPPRKIQQTSTTTHKQSNSILNKHARSQYVTQYVTLFDPNKFSGLSRNRPQDRKPKAVFKYNSSCTDFEIFEFTA